MQLACRQSSTVHTNLELLALHEGLPWPSLQAQCAYDSSGKHGWLMMTAKHAIIGPIAVEYISGDNWDPIRTMAGTRYRSTNGSNKHP
jgi:hypothetical protein